MAKPQNKFGLFFLILLLFLVVSLQLYIGTPDKPKHTLSSKAAGNTFFGFNIHSLNLLSAGDTSQILNMVSQCNSSSVVRLWGSVAGGDGNQARLFNAIDNLGKTLSNAPANIQFIVTLSNYYSNTPPQPWSSAQENPTQWFASDWKTNGYKDFVQQVTSKYRGNPKILIWELMNEPNCDGSDACTKAQHQFFADVSSIIAQNDPGKLISPGTQAQNTGGERFDRGDFADIARMPNITALSCHLQLGDGVSTLDNCTQALQIAKQNNKFFYIGELGDSIGCTTTECVNSCSQDKLSARKDKLLQISKQLSDLGSGGTLIWQFSPERNSTLTCDDASIFPGDPFCSISGGGGTGGGNTGGGTGGGGNGGGGAGGKTNGGTNQVGLTTNFIPLNPNPNTAFNIELTSSPGYQWVHLKIFKAADKSIAWEAPKDGSQPKVTQGNPNKWVYTTAGLPIGDYLVQFYSDCDQGCKEVGSPSTLSIGTGKTNTQQTQQTQTNTQTQTQTQTQTNQTQPQQTTQNQNPQNYVFDANLCNEKIQVPGPKQFKLNIIFLASNYNDLNKFLDDAKTAAGNMYKTNLGPNRVNKINFWAYKSINAPLPVKSCRSAAGFSTVCTDENQAKTMSDDCGMNGYVVIVDHPRKAASTLALGTIQVTMTSSALESLPHELGHAVASVFDEYDFQDDRPPNIPVPANCSAESSGDQNIACPPWKKYNDVGCFSRCGFWSWYKPTAQSIMNHLQNSYAFNSPSLDAWDFALQQYDKYQ